MHSFPTAEGPAGPRAARSTPCPRPGAAPSPLLEVEVPRNMKLHAQNVRRTAGAFAVAAAAAGLVLTGCGKTTGAAAAGATTGAATTGATTSGGGSTATASAAATSSASQSS